MNAGPRRESIPQPERKHSFVCTYIPILVHGWMSKIWIVICYLQIILASVILNTIAAKPSTQQSVVKNEEKADVTDKIGTKAIIKEHGNHTLTLTEIQDKNFFKSKHRKQTKKSKRDAYGNANYWASKSNYKSNMPQYLVFNRKVGAYYPYYKFPKENSIRRSSYKRNVGRQ